MKTKNSYYPVIQAILERKGTYFVLLFDNFEIKKIELKKLVEKAPGNPSNDKKLLQEEYLEKAKISHGTLHFPQIDKDFHIDPFTLYELSEPAIFKFQYISTIRKLKGYTQKQVADKLKISQTELSELESGESPNIKLCAVLVSFLLG